MTNDHGFPKVFPSLREWEECLDSVLWEKKKSRPQVYTICFRINSSFWEKYLLSRKLLGWEDYCSGSWVILGTLEKYVWPSLLQEVRKPEAFSSNSKEPFLNIISQWSFSVTSSLTTSWGENTLVVRYSTDRELQELLRESLRNRYIGRRVLTWRNKQSLESFFSTFFIVSLSILIESVLCHLKICQISSIYYRSNI